MTLAAIGGWTEFPHYGNSIANGPGNVTLDATTDYIGFVCHVPATGTIDKIHQQVGSTTLSGTLSCQIQTLDASGDPSGSAYGSCSQVDVAVTGSEDNTQITFTGLNCSATIGDYICIRIWPTVVSSGSINIQASAAPGGVEGFPYYTARTSGTGAGAHSSTCQGPAIEYSGGVYYNVGWTPATNFSQEGIDSDSSVRILGNRFILAAPLTVVGAWAHIDNDTDTTTLILVDTDGTTILGTATLVAAARVGAARTTFRALFTAPVDLSANTAQPYRIAASTNNTTATAAAVNVATFGAAAHMGMMPCGTSMYHTTWNGSAWADTDTKRAAIGLLVSKFDAGGGSGGGGRIIGGTVVR